MKSNDKGLASLHIFHSESASFPEVYIIQSVFFFCYLSHDIEKF